MHSILSLNRLMNRGHVPHSVTRTGWLSSGQVTDSIEMILYLDVSGGFPYCLMKLSTVNSGANGSSMSTTILNERSGI